MLSYALCSTYVPQIESLPREILLILDDYLGDKKLEIYLRLTELSLTDVQMTYFTHGSISSSSLTVEDIKRRNKNINVREQFLEYILENLKQLSLMYKVVQIFYRPSKKDQCEMEQKHRVETILNDTDGRSHSLYLTGCMAYDRKYRYQVVDDYTHYTGYVSREEMMLTFLACQYDFNWKLYIFRTDTNVLENKIRVTFKVKEYSPKKKEMMSYRVLKNTYYTSEDLK